MSTPGLDPQPPSPTPPRRSVVEVGAYRIHTEERGGGEEAVVLVHGLSGSGRWWWRNAPALAREYRVLIPDLVGFGRSARPRPLPALPEVAGLLATWVERLSLERVHLVGHSMGGLVAAYLAAGHPERVDRLVLVDAAGIPRPLSPAALVRFAAEVTPLWRWGDPTFLPTIAGDALAAGPRVLLEAVGHLARADVRTLLPSIRAPTLVVWGERDSFVPLADGYEFRRLVPGARLAVLRGVGHNPMVDRPADFNRLVLRFLGGESVGR